jgi:hypothetical protein
MPAATKASEKKTESKESKQEKYGEIDDRWTAHRDPRLWYVLEVFEAGEGESAEGEPPPAEKVTYIVQDPDGNRTEMDPEEFNEQQFEPVSRAKMDQVQVIPVATEA